MNLLRNILVGGIDPQLEEILAEGKSLEQCRSSKNLHKRKRARIAIISVRDLISDIDMRVRISSLSFI